MKQDLEEIYQQERQLSDQKWNIEKDQRKVTQAKEAYQDHFHCSDRLFDEYTERFRNTEFGHLFDELKDNLFQEKRRIFEQLEENNEELKKEHRSLDDQLSELFYKKKMSE